MEWEMNEEDKEFYRDLDDVGLLTLVYRGFSNELIKYAKCEQSVANAYYMPDDVEFYESDWMFELAEAMRQIRMMKSGQTELLKTAFWQEFIETLRYELEKGWVTLEEVNYKGYAVGDLCDYGDGPFDLKEVAA